jgi:hypothetical protein
MPEKDSFMASRLSLGTRIRCQSLCLRHPLRASEIDSLRGQAVTADHAKKAKVCAARTCTSDKSSYLFAIYQTNKRLTYCCG